MSGPHNLFLGDVPDDIWEYLTREKATAGQDGRHRTKSEIIYEVIRGFGN